MIEDRLSRMQAAAERKLAQALTRLQSTKPGDKAYAAALLLRRQAEEMLERVRRARAERRG